MAAGVNDKYSNILALDITMSAADTLTFEEVEIGVNIFDKVGLLLHRVDIEVSNATKTALTAAADFFDVALVQSNQITTLSLQERAVIDKIKIGGLGTGANGFTTVREPWTLDYTGLPGGGLLTTPSPLWIAMDSASMAATIGFATVRMYFTLIKLKPEEYFELLEARRFFG